MQKKCSNCFSEYNEPLGVCPKCGYAEGDKPKDSFHLAPGHTLKDTYITGMVLGSGGFGVTYLAWNKKLEQKVAIKEYLPSEFSTRIPGNTQVTVFTGEKAEQFNDGAKKFVDEAKRLAQFRNIDGIVQIYESFFENNTAYIVMEHLDGQTLTKYLEKNGKLSGDEAFHLIRPVIHALRVVHEQGIIHRDIAPDNIIITKEGQAKLIDFGAARFATTTHSRSLTVVIKTGYSPEEQYRSRSDQGPWTDVYAIAATMYRMITGITPPDALERRASLAGEKKDILQPISNNSRKINKNQEIAILNAMNVRIEDRTSDMEKFEEEFTSEGVVIHIDQGIEPEPRPMLWLKYALISVSCIIVTLFALFFTGIIPGGGNGSTPTPDPDDQQDMVIVPSVINKSISEAEERINNRLILQIVGKEESEAIPVNMVLSQNIPAGSRVHENTELLLVISAGTEADAAQMITLIDVQYRTKEQAIELLELQGLSITIVEENSETVAEGLVISQYPESGTMLSGINDVTISVSIGLPKISMPDVVAMEEAAAISALNNLGIDVEIDYSMSDNVPVGSIAGQSIAEGSVVQRGDVVTIYVNIERPPIGINIGETAPNFTLTLRGGGEVTLWDLRGMPVLLNFCTTWCPPCQYEFPHIQAVHDAYKDKIIVLGVSSGETVREVDTYFNQFDYDYMLAYDPDYTLYYTYKVDFIPQTWILDKNGVIVDYLDGSRDFNTFELSISKVID